MGWLGFEQAGPGPTELYESGGGGVFLELLPRRLILHHGITDCATASHRDGEGFGVDRERNSLIPDDIGCQIND